MPTIRIPKHIYESINNKFQEGGKMSNKEGLLSTGNFIYGNEKILESDPKRTYYQQLLQGKNILNTEFDVNTNEYIITYE